MPFFQFGIGKAKVDPILTRYPSAHVGDDRTSITGHVHGLSPHQQIPAIDDGNHPAFDRQSAGRAIITLGHVTQTARRVGGSIHGDGAPVLNFATRRIQVADDYFGV